MDFMRLFGTVIAVLFHPGSASKLNGQRICRSGTERPCYKASYIHDSRRRLTFEDARQACRLDGGELLSIETESEQRLIERYIQTLETGNGDFWIGLRRNPQRYRAGTTNAGCPSQYYWLDGSKAKFRNWHWDEPSCGMEMCVVLYHQPSAPPEGRFLFQWNDDNCSSKNNFVCKYPEEKLPVFTVDRKTVYAVPSVRPKISLTTESNERIKIGLPESSVPPLIPNFVSTTESNKQIKIALPESSISFSENTLYVYYILYAAIPVLLLLLFSAAGFFCYKQHIKRRKTETESYPSRSKQWMLTTASSGPVQGPYAYSDITKLPHTALDSGIPAEIMTKYSYSPSHDSQCNDYENVSCVDRESGFVTNDIYEPCRAQSRRSRSQTGWVENEIYG